MIKKFTLTKVLVLLVMLKADLFAQSGATFKQWGEETFAAIERDYRMPNSALYRENVGGTAFAYNWPLGIQFSALIAGGKIAQAEALANEAHDKYWCFKNNIWGYSATHGDCGSRFYDDNAWMAKGLMELYKATNNVTYLNRAKEVLEFVMSGEFAPSSDPFRTTGSIKWDEGTTTNWCLCGSAPAAASNLLVYEATGDTKYLNDGLRIYNWAKTNRWGAGGGYRGYENAVLAQAAVTAFRTTRNQIYFNDARHIGYKMETFYVDWATRSLFETGQWGGHDMTNAYVDLYEMDGDINWLNIAAGYLSHIHQYGKDADGRYPEDWGNPTSTGGRTGLLHQAPVANAFARMGHTPGGITKVHEPVAIFQDCNFNGRWNTGLNIGKYTQADLAFLGVPNKDLSSLRVSPGYKLTLYAADNFTGDSLIRTADETCAVGAGWNDRAVSMKVEAISPTVLIYKDVNYKGLTLNLTPGSYSLAQLQARGINDNEISSIAVSEGFIVTAYENGDFTGASVKFNPGNDSSLIAKNWNDRIGSITILRKGAIATFYTDCKYEGAAADFAEGNYDINAFTGKGIANDAISSVEIAQGYEAVIYQNWDFTGDSTTITGKVSCLAGNFDNWISSFKIRPARANNFSTLIQAEDYSAMAGVQTEATTDTDGGLNVGWIEANDWMAYHNITIPKTGDYTIEYRVASPSGASLSADLNAGTTVLGVVTIPATGGWQNWTTVSHTVNIPEGTHSFGIFAPAAGWNINWIKIASASGKAKREGIAESIIADNSSTLSFFPNPVAGKLKIKFLTSLSGAQIKIFDAQGQESVSTIISTAEDVDVSSLGAGIYHAVIVKDGKRITERFIKN